MIPFLRKIYKLLCLFTLLLFSSFAFSDEKPPKFQIEIVVFETYALKGWTEEYWPADIDIIDTDEAMPEIPLKPESFLLNDEVAKMTPKMGYNILYHSSWIVDALPEDKAKEILIFRPYDAPGSDSRLQGSIKFWKSRFPHVMVNLELEREIPFKVREDFARQHNIEPDLLPDFWHFQIKESRKIKTGQLHYLDHPIFGALVAIKWRPELTK